MTSRITDISIGMNGRVDSSWKTIMWLMLGWRKAFHVTDWDVTWGSHLFSFIFRVINSFASKTSCVSCVTLFIPKGLFSSKERHEPMIQSSRIINLILEVSLFIFEASLMTPPSPSSSFSQNWYKVFSELKETSTLITEGKHLQRCHLEQPLMTPSVM
jgi:hypothetical protein